MSSQSTITAPSQSLPHSVSTIPQVVALLDVRHDASNEELCAHIRSNFHGNINSLKILEPFVREVLRRFKHLPRKKNVDGTRPSIGGETSFAKWCPAVLGKTARTVRYMLAGGNKKRNITTGKDVSAVCERITKYLDKRFENFNETEQAQIANHIVEHLRRGEVL
jgi:hypothetical protein